MKKAIALVACGAALATGGVFAGSVLGGDGSTPIVDRLPGGSWEQSGKVEVVRDLEPAPGATASGNKKVKILKGSGDPQTVVAGGSQAGTMRCPKKYSAISAGIGSEGPGVVPGYLGPAIKSSGAIDTRGMFIAVLNINSIDLDWEPWITCAKGVKDVS